MRLFILSHRTNPKITTIIIIIHWIQFTAKEVAFMTDAPADPLSPSGTAPQLKRFYRMWCLKESIVKALGVGIHFNLKSFEFDVQDEEETTKVKNIHLSWYIRCITESGWCGEDMAGQDIYNRKDINNRELKSSKGTGRVKRNCKRW